MGRDVFMKDSLIPIVGISTHTPAWGATKKLIVEKNRKKNFNSHARVGRDVM